MQTDSTAITADPIGTDFETRKREFFRNLNINPELNCLMHAADLGMAELDKRIIAYEFGLRVEQVEKWIPLFYEFGIWYKDSNGKLKTIYYKNRNDDEDLLSVSTFALRQCMLISPFGPCFYSYNSISTNKELINEYVKNIKKLTSDFVDKSNAIENPNAVFSTMVMSANVLEARKIARMDGKI